MTVGIIDQAIHSFREQRVVFHEQRAHQDSPHVYDDAREHAHDFAEAWDFDDDEWREFMRRVREG